MRTIYILFFLTTMLLGHGQTKITEEQKKVLKDLSDSYDNVKKSYDSETDVFKELKNKITTSISDDDYNALKEQVKKLGTIYVKLDSIYKLADSHKNIFLSMGIKDDELKSLFNKEKVTAPSEPKSESEEPKVYYYFGKNKVINEQDGLFKDKKFNLIFNDVLEAKSENYLGDFIIPQKGQSLKMLFYKTEKKALKNNQSKQIDTSYWVESKKVFFKSIKIHIREGSLDEIQLLVTDEDNNELLFENKIPISLLRATRLFSRNSLFFRTASSNNKDIPISMKCSGNNSECYKILLSDVLVYIPNPGDNYIPEDLTLEFPTKIDGSDENINNSVKYKINQDTSLQNIVELRTYTDFLGLFTENSANGIVQMEGKADFFIAPTLVSANYPFYMFKKISPFVNFSKIEKDVRNVSLAGAIGAQTIEQPLDILQKSYLKMGVNLSLVSFKLRKEFPFEINFYANAKYQISDLMKADSTVVDYKSLGVGYGFELEFKRFNNFGFIFSMNRTEYNTKSFNVIDGMTNPNNFWVLKNEAEVYYYPNKTKQQSIFLRLKTFNNSTAGNDEAFYQLQFGYRFSIGVSKLKQ